MTRKKIFKFAAMAAVVLYCVVFVLFIFPLLSAQEQKDYNSGIKNVVLSLWHLDLFEGGTGSREGFLARAAIDFEKQHPGVYIATRSLSVAQLAENLAQGNIPDIISYGAGVADIILPHLISFEGTVTAFANLVDAGEYNNRLFAVPWAAGGYVAAAKLSNLAAVVGSADQSAYSYAQMLTSSALTIKKNTLYSFVYGSAKYNNPMLALYCAHPAARFLQNSYDGGQYSQAEGYQRFISGYNSVFLLGTQRDAVRLRQREDFADYGIQALKGYTDLVCYLSVTSKNHSQSATLFIEHMLSDSVQRALVNINMLSVNLEGLYPEGIMAEMQKLLPQQTVLSAFISQQQLEDCRMHAHRALSGDSQSLNFVQQLLAN